MSELLDRAFPGGYEEEGLSELDTIELYAKQLGSALSDRNSRIVTEAWTLFKFMAGGPLFEQGGTKDSFENELSHQEKSGRLFPLQLLSHAVKELLTWRTETEEAITALRGMDVGIRISGDIERIEVAETFYYALTHIRNSCPDAREDGFYMQASEELFNSVSSSGYGDRLARYVGLSVELVKDEG